MHNPALRARSLVALIVALAALAVWSPRASADTPASSGRDACNYDGWSFYACLHFDYKGYGWWNASTVLHVNMSTDYARGVINCGPGAQFRASLWGRDEDNDHSQDDFIRNLVLTPGWPQASYNGLDARFYTVDIPDSQLDEDDGTDELFVRMSYRDCNTGFTRTFDTDDMVGNFG
jgi:hypothetical protein